MNFRSDLRGILPKVKPIVREGGTRLVVQAALRGEIAHVRKAVAALPNTSALFATRESYRDVGYAIKAALPDQPDEALTLFQEWCARWTDGTNDPEIVEADWRRMKPPFRRGASWLYELAARHGGGRFAWGEQWFQPSAEPLFPATEAAAGSDRKFTLVPAREAARLALEQSSRPLIEGLIDAGVMSVVYGDSNIGKTFVALDMGYCIAAGRPWAGLKTAQGAVVYLAAEGGRGIFRRTTALTQKYGPAESFFVVSSPVDLFQSNADLQPLARDILDLKIPIMLLVVDTLARAMAGGDENSTKDMGAFVRNVDRLRAVLAAHIMLIHHTGKDASRGARGSSALRAATDTEIEITKGSIAVTKQRDLDKSLSFSFDLIASTIGNDADGKAISSCTVSVATEAPMQRGANMLSPREREVLDAVLALHQDQPGSAVTAVQVAAAVGDNDDKGPGRVRQQLKALTTAGLLSKAGTGKWRSSDPSWFFEAEAVRKIDDEMSAASASQPSNSLFN